MSHTCPRPEAVNPRSSVPPDGAYTLDRGSTLRLIDEIEAGLAGDVEAVLLRAGEELGAAWEWLPGAARRSETGLVLARAGAAMVAIVPPFPFEPAPCGTAPPAPLKALRDLLVRRRLVAVVLVRLGAYAVGVLYDGRLILSKTGTRYVPAPHRAGGQSQRRFERGRERWIRELYDEVCDVCRSRLGPYADDLQHLAIGGDRHVLNAFLKRCEWLAPIAARLLPPRVPVQRPGLAALRHAGAAIWSSRVYVRRP